MKIIECEQNSPEWYASRNGIPTASEFKKIITPTGGESRQAEGYANHLIAEMMVGHEVESFESSWMARGKELEVDAAAFYAMNNADLVKVGFCTDDAGTMGCSPDRLVGDDGLLEIKVTAPHTHVSYLLSGQVDRDYYPQIQGQLLVTGRKWVDWMSYHAEMPPAIIRVFRDDKYIFEMTKLIANFNKMLNEKKQILTKKGIL